MSFKEKEHSLECLKPIVYNIIDKFKGQKGIIQTGNYDIAKQIVFFAPPEAQKRMLLYDGSKDKIAVIRKHKYSDDTILVGPTLCEGVETAEDDGIVLGRLENERSGASLGHIFYICKALLAVEDLDAVLMIPVAGNHYAAVVQFQPGGACTLLLHAAEAVESVALRVVEFSEEGLPDADGLRTASAK